MDVERLEAESACQQELCRLLTALGSSAFAPLVVTATNERERPHADLIREFERLQKDIQHRSRVHAALLVRARRSVNFLANMIAGMQPAYESPREPALIAAEE